jgi:predicted dehydrogenase
MGACRVGIAGFGRIGAEHAIWISRSSEITATAAFDVTPARRDLARKAGLAIHETFVSLISDPAIDAVLIATPTSLHHEQAMKALRAGKHVMVEKPMAMNLAQAKEMVETARSAGRVLSVFHNRRWDADYLTVCAAIASGIFGRIFNIESRLGQWASCVGPAAKEFRPNWRNEAAFGGGGLLDWGSHILDQLSQLMLPTKPTRLFAQLRGNVWTRDTDDFARIAIDFDNGAAGLVEINTTTTQPLPRWHIDAANGSAQSPFSLDFDTQKWAELDFHPPGGTARRLPPAAPGLTETDIWQQFAEAITGTSEPAVTPESVLPTMALLDATRESSRRGIGVELNV